MVLWRMVCLCMGMAGALGVPLQLWAQAELFAPTEAKSFAMPQRLSAETARSLEQLFAGIEPAAGHEPAPKEGKGAPEETGEPSKAANGKTVGKAPALPQITIGGKPVLTQEQMLAEETSSTTPDILKKPFFVDLLTQRFQVNTYSHSPRRGDPKAPVTVHQFMDLSCTPCLEKLAKLEETLAPYTSQTQVIHIYAPADQSQPTNLAAFYGKVAERNGTFWAYRDQLIKAPQTDASGMLAALIASGVSESEARTLMLSESRRFYRELDADTLITKSMGAEKPPLLFVNGIRVGDQGIPPEHLKDIMEYVSNRLAHHLPEPPK